MTVDGDRKKIKYLQTSDKSYQVYKELDKSRVIEVTFTKMPEV